MEERGRKVIRQRGSSGFLTAAFLCLYKMIAPVEAETKDEAEGDDDDEEEEEDGANTADNTSKTA